MDYEKEYQKTNNACGQLFPEFQEFFANYDKHGAAVLDLGCGQGRDALFIASRGHSVTGVDISPTGVAQMLDQAKARGLKIEGIVGDIVGFRTRQRFDAVVIDRVLHQLPSDEDRLAVLRRSSSYVKKGGYVLIADTPKHKQLIADFFATLDSKWETTKRKKGIQFFQRTS